VFAVSVNRYDNTVVAMGECVRMEHWWNHCDRSNQHAGGKPVPLPLCVTQKPHGQPWK